MSTNVIPFQEVHAELTTLDGICAMRTRNVRGAVLDGFIGEVDSVNRFLLFCAGLLDVYAENPMLGQHVTAFDEQWQFVSATFGQIDARIVTPVEVDSQKFSLWLTYDKGDRITLSRFRICDNLVEAIAHAKTIFKTSWAQPTALIGLTIIAPGGNSPEFVNGVSR